MAGKQFIISTILLMMVFFIVIIINARGIPQVTETNLEKLPMTIGKYHGEEDFFSDAINQELNADKYVYRHYRNVVGETVDLYVGYYGTAKGGRTGHNPYACLPGAGWAITGNKSISLVTDNYPDGVSVNLVFASKEGVGRVLVHWYQTAGVTVLSTGIQQNIHRFLGRVLHNRNDGAYVQISALADEDTLPDAQMKVKMFAEELLSILPEYWPVEK